MSISVDLSVSRSVSSADFCAVTSRYTVTTSPVGSR